MLKEISIMRPLLILQVIVYHAFIIYWGGWEQPIGFKDVYLYRQIAGWSYSFMLEAFTFISGFIYIYTTKQKGLQDFGLLMKKKTRRLLVPMVVFGIAYFFLFEDRDSVVKSLYAIFSGVGHLWYLLMLYWCFVLSWLLRSIKIDNRVAFVGVAFLAIFCSWMPLPLQIGKSFYFLFFFYLPVFIVDKREFLANRLLDHQGGALLLWGIFIISFLLFKSVLGFPMPYKELPTLQKALTLSMNNFVQIIYSSLGVVAFYMTALLIAGGAKIIRRDSLIVRIGNYCFGIYIFQQFILKGLYFNTPVPSIVGPYILPWAGVLVALIVSFILTYLIRLTKVGREIL